MNNLKNPQNDTYLNILNDECYYDKRYYNFGSYLNLCGSTPQELMPKCCCCNDSGGTELIDNYISVDLANKDDKWELIVASDSPLASDILITVTYNYTIDDVTSSKDEIFSLKSSSSSTILNLNIPNNTSEVTITNIKLTPSSDDVFNYIIIEKSNYKLYYGVSPIKETNNITSTEIEAMDSLSVNDGSENDLSFIIPAIGIEGIDDIEDENEVNEILRDNAYDLVIAYDSKIKDYEIIDLFGNNDDKFTVLKNITINNIDYTIIVRSDPDTQRNVYDTNTGPIPFAPITYSFNLK